MTPKERAQALVDQFQHFSSDLLYRADIDCALVVVDEILDNFGLASFNRSFYTSYSTLQYYEQVKKELNKLK
jgi:hypothetical protein